MPDSILSCEQVRERIASWQEGTAPAAGFEAHLASCAACLEAALEAALREPAEVLVPAGFAARTLERAPVAEEPEPSTLSWAVAAASVVFVGLGVLAATNGQIEALGRWMGEMRASVLLAILGLEGVLCLSWFWRVVETG